MKLKRIIRKSFNRYYKRSYSQSGEDMILNTIFAGVKKGFYVDVGANDPFRQSNTCFFYRKGWNGINIDPNEVCIKKLRINRKKDINIRALISDKNTEIDYYYYEKSLYNGCDFNPDIPSRLLFSEKIMSRTLSSVLEKFNCVNIDFLSIDTEGHELHVLKSLDLRKFRPKIILIESFKTNVHADLISNETKYLMAKDYFYFSRTVSNTIYISQEFVENRFPEYYNDLKSNN